jgi:hypothetical protein
MRARCPERVSERCRLGIPHVRPVIPVLRQLAHDEEGASVRCASAAPSVGRSGPFPGRHDHRGPPAARSAGTSMVTALFRTLSRCHAGSRDPAARKARDPLCSPPALAWDSRPRAPPQVGGISDRSRGSGAPRGQGVRLEARRKDPCTRGRRPRAVHDGLRPRVPLPWPPPMSLARPQEPPARPCAPRLPPRSLALHP